MVESSDEEDEDEYDEDDDFIDDDDAGDDYSAHIKQIFGYDKSKYVLIFWPLFYCCFGSHSSMLIVRDVSRVQLFKTNNVIS